MAILFYNSTKHLEPAAFFFLQEFVREKKTGVPSGKALKVRYLPPLLEGVSVDLVPEGQNKYRFLLKITPKEPAFIKYYFSDRLILSIVS